MQEEPKCVWECANMAQFSIAQSLLLDAGIPVLGKNNEMQHLFGLGAIGGVNHLIGHPQIWVGAEHVEVARELLDRAFDDDPDTNNDGMLSVGELVNMTHNIVDDIEDM